MSEINIRLLQGSLNYVNISYVHSEYETLSKVSMPHTLIASSVFADGKRYDAYISHSDNDTQFVLCLKRQLERKGYSVYVAAVENIPGGGEYKH